MAEGPSDPDFDLLSESGRENFKRYFEAEEPAIANTSSKDSEYGWIRKAALAFFQTYYAGLQSDAVIPYTAVTFVDRVYLLLGHKIVDKFSSDNYKLLFTYCLYRSWRVRTKKINVENFLSCIGLDCFTDKDVLNVGNTIPIAMDWSSPITPFFFVELFAPFLTLQPPTSALRPVYELIVSSQYKRACTQFRPSVIALSSILVFIDKECPYELDSFKSRVSKYDLFAPLVELEEMVEKCQTILKPIYAIITAKDTYTYLSLIKSLFTNIAQPVIKTQRDSSKVMEIEMTEMTSSGGDSDNDSVALLKMPLQWDKFARSRNG